MEKSTSIHPRKPEKEQQIEPKHRRKQNYQIKITLKTQSQKAVKPKAGSLEKLK